MKTKTYELLFDEQSLLYLETAEYVFGMLKAARRLGILEGGMTMKLNQVAHLQTEIAHAYMRAHNLSPADFVELDSKYDILGFIETGYDMFHYGYAGRS